MNDFSQSSSQVSLPESLEISADVTDFTMSSTYTVALSDILEDLNVKEIVDYSSLQSALDELENAALELVSGTDTLSSRRHISSRRGRIRRRHQEIYRWNGYVGKWSCILCKWGTTVSRRRKKPYGIERRLIPGSVSSESA